MGIVAAIAQPSVVGPTSMGGTGQSHFAVEIEAIAVRPRGGVPKGDSMAISNRFGFTAGAVLALCLATPAMADCVDMDTFVYPSGEVAFAERVADALTLAIAPPPQGWRTYSATTRYPKTEDCSTGERARTVRRTRAEVSTFIGVARLGTSPESQFRIILVGNRITPDATGKFVDIVQLGAPNPAGAAGRLYNVTIRIAPMPGGSNGNATAPIAADDLQVLRGMIDQVYLQSLIDGNVPTLEEAKARKTARLAEIETASNNNVNALSQRGGNGGGSAPRPAQSTQSAPQPRPSSNPAVDVLKRLPGRLFR